MSIDWIISALAICGILALPGFAALYLVVSTKKRMRRQQRCHLAESESLREAVDALKRTVGELDAQLRKVCVEQRQNESAPAASSPATGLNASKRAEALRMFRRGSNKECVSTALGLKTAEAALLEKVHFLSTGAS